MFRDIDTTLNVTLNERQKYANACYLTHADGTLHVRQKYAKAVKTLKKRQLDAINRLERAMTQLTSRAPTYKDVFWVALD